MAQASARLVITIDIFSGRENPVVELSGKALQDAVKRLAPGERMERRGAGLPPVPTLGYRGLLVEQHGLSLKGLPRAFRVADGFALGPEFAARIADEGFEDFVCGSVPKKLELSAERLTEAVLEYRALADYWRIHGWKDAIFRRAKCKCAPVFEPAWWNVPARQPFNNCYNYGCNYRTDTFAQPGKAAGQMYGSLTCSAVKAAAIKDELIDRPAADNKCPKKGHLVALVVAPGWDFHWYRKGRNGRWSHKPGGTAVTNLDNSGNSISDPRTADRGPYTDFCTFMVVKHGHIKIA